MINNFVYTSGISRCAFIFLNSELILTDCKFVVENHQFQPVDPLVQGLENLEKRLREKLDQIHKSMMEEIHYIANEHDVDDFLDVQFYFELNLLKDMSFEAIYEA